MKYLLLVTWDADQMNAQEEPEPGTEDEDDKGFPWLDDLQARGIWQIGDQLAPPRRAKTVRVRRGEKLVIDGPFVETKEALGGFDLIECDSFDEVIENVAGDQISEFGSIDVWLL